MAMVLHTTFVRAVGVRQRVTAALLMAVACAGFVLLLTGQPSMAAPMRALARNSLSNGPSTTAQFSLTVTTLITQTNLTVTKAGNGAGRVASTPSGIDCGANCTAFYDQGAPVTLTASADPGSTFTGWQGACTGVGAVCTILVNTATNVTAVFTLNQYQVSAAKAGNGLGQISSIPAGIDCGSDCTEFYAHGTVITMNANADPSSTFAGWVGACSGNQPVCTITVDTAKSVTAIFILNQYALTLNKSGRGIGKVMSTPSGLDCGNTCAASYPHGTALTLTATAATGSTFTGWQGACTNTTITCTVTIDATKVVTATFALKQYSLTVRQQGAGAGVLVVSPNGASCSGACTSQLDHGTAVTLTATAALSSTFSGWQGACTGNTPICALTMDSAKVVTATFALKQLPITVNKGGNGAGIVSSIPAGINCGFTCTQSLTYGTAVTLTATAADHSRFTGWQGACTGNRPTCTLTALVARQVTATFTLNQYTFAVILQGNGHGLVTSSPRGIACGITCTVTLNYGAALTLTAVPFTDTLFTGWQGACTGGSPTCVVTLAADAAVTATFTLKQYALTVARTGSGAGIVTSTPPGLDCGITCTVHLVHGTPLTLTATAALSSTFIGWQGACTGLTPVCALTIDHAQQVTATFALNYHDLTVVKTGKGTGLVTSIPAGLDCGLTCTVRATHGTVITLTATPDPFATFTEWQGACSGTVPVCTVNVTAPQIVTATFGYQQVALTVTKSGSGAGLVTSVPPAIDCGSTCTALIDHGTVITLTATPGPRSAFVGWRGACTDLGPCVVAMTTATAITATFTGVPVASLAAAIAVTPTIAATGQPLTYTYWITNTGDLSVTVAALSTHIGNPVFMQQPEQTILTATSYLRPGATAVAIQPSVAPRCNANLPLEETLTVTGTTANGITATAQVSLTVPLTNSLLLPQTAKANTIYSGCTIQMAFGRSNTPFSTYDMVVIVGEAPSGLLFQGVQSTQSYRDAFTLQEQTNALLNEGCPTTVGCRTIRRLVIEQGKAIQVETITNVVAVHRLFMPLVRR